MNCNGITRYREDRNSRELFVQVFVDLLGVAILLKQATEDAKSANPEDLDGHTSIGSTASFAEAHVTAFPASLSPPAASEAGMNCHWLADDKTIFHQLPHSLSLSYIPIYIIQCIKYTIRVLYLDNLFSYDLLHLLFKNY